MKIVIGPTPADIAEALAAVLPRLGPFAGQFSWFEEASSTNDLAMARAREGAAEGLVVAADAQTSGRGRLGRTWVSPAGAGIYVSVVLRPPAGLVSLVSIAAGVAVAEGVEAATGLPAGVKWPNDVYVGSRKLAGVLAELGSGDTGALFVVLGFGINVRPAVYPPDVAARATSIESELGRPCDRGLVLAHCLAQLAGRYRDLRNDRFEAVRSAWRARAGSSLGRVVEWDTDGTTRRGTAHDIDVSGALVVRADEDMVHIVSGEVRWLS